MAIKRWQCIELPIFSESLSTGTYPLSQHQAPTWVARAPRVTGACLHYMGGPVVTSTSALSTGCISAILTVERTHPTAAPEDRVRYDDFLLARHADGRFFQLGPDKRLAGRHHPDLRHHESQRSAWMSDAYLNSTSTGW